VCSWYQKKSKIRAELTLTLTLTFTQQIVGEVFPGGARREEGDILDGAERPKSIGGADTLAEKYVLRKIHKVAAKTG